MKAFKKIFEYVSSLKYFPLYAISTTNKTTVVITERDIQIYSEEHSKFLNLNHLSFFMIERINRKKNKISIEANAKKAKKGYINESDIVNGKFKYEFETNDATNFIIWLNRALYRVLTTEELKSINNGECQEFITSFPTSSSVLDNDGLIVQNSSKQSKEIQPFYIYSRFKEKVLLENSPYFTKSIESIVNKVSLENLRRILKYKVSKIDVFKEFPDCQKYFSILINDIVPLLKSATNLIFDATNVITANNNTDNNFHYVQSLIKLNEKSSNIREITFCGNLPADINDFFTSLCEKKQNSIKILSFQNSFLNQTQLAILKSSFITCFKSHNSTFDSNQTLLDFLRAKKLSFLNINNSPQIDFLSNLNKFANISVLSLSKCNIDISEFFIFLSRNKSQIRYLYLSGNKCEKEISNDLTIPKFEEIRIDHITWGDYFLSCLQLLLKSQTFIDFSNALMTENEWNKVFDYLNTTSDGASQLIKLLWNGNKVSKSFFSYLKKCSGTLDSLQIIDVIDQTTEKGVISEFASFLKESNKLVNLFIGFSKQTTRNISGNQLKMILSALLANKTNSNSKSFYFSVAKSSSGDEGVDALINAFNNQKVCKIGFVNFDGLRPKSSKKFNELCSSISKCLSKSSKNNEPSCKIEYPKNDLECLKGLMKKEDYKKLCRDFCFNMRPNKLDFFPCDYLFDRTILSPRLEKKRFADDDSSEGFVDSLGDLKNKKKNGDRNQFNNENSDSDEDELVRMLINDTSSITRPNRKYAIDSTNENSNNDELADDIINDDFTNNSNEEKNNSNDEKNNQKIEISEKNEDNKDESSYDNKDNDDPINLNENEKNSSNELNINNKNDDNDSANAIDIDNTDNSNTSNKNKPKSKINKAKKDESESSPNKSFKNKKPDFNNKNIAKKRQISIEFEEEEEEANSEMANDKIDAPSQSNDSVKINSSSSHKKNKDKFPKEEEEDLFEKDSYDNKSKSKKSKTSTTASFTPNRSFKQKQSAASSNTENQNEQPQHSKLKRVKKSMHQEEKSSLMSFPFSSINSVSFEYDDHKKTRIHRIKRLNEIEDDYYEFYEKDYDESDSDSVDINKNSMNDQSEFNFTPVTIRNRKIPQTASVERSRKVDLLKGLVPKTVKQNRKRRRRLNHELDDAEMKDHELNVSKRSPYRGNGPNKSSLKQKKNNIAYETIEDNGSDIEFPEMEEITIKRQNKIWNAIEEKFSLQNIIQNIRSNK